MTWCSATPAPAAGPKATPAPAVVEAAPAATPAPTPAPQPTTAAPEAAAPTQIAEETGGGLPTWLIILIVLVGLAIATTVGILVVNNIRRGTA